MEKLEELASLQNQVKVVRLKDKLGEQNFHENIKKVLEPVTDTIKITSEMLTKSITENSITNNKALENLNNKLLEIMNDRGISATYLMSPLSKFTNPETTNQLKLVKDSSSNRVNNLLIKNTIPITLHDNLLAFRDTDKVFELKIDLLKMITYKNYNVNLASLGDKKLMSDFAKEMHFDVRGIGKKSTRGRTFIKLLKSPAIVTLGISTIFLSSDPDELCELLKLLLQETHVGNNSDIINDEIVAIIDKLLEYKFISKKQLKQFIIKCNLLQYKVCEHVFCY